jgi:hypothetical protein
MCGIEAHACFDSRFQRLRGGKPFPGALPQARHEPAPLALSEVQRSILRLTPARRSLL